ncbi:MAG: hypothetical protein J6L99_01065 [Ruminococcus sp.]|nr:hypothetical protein [Ruminococcus sp.]
MDDMMGKLSELLSDGESVRQISELAKMFMDETGTQPGQGDESGSSESPQEPGFDIGKVMQLTSLAGAMSQKDPNTDLLLALRPHLSPEKQQRVDKAVRLLKLLAVFSVAKENGLLKDFI